MDHLQALREHLIALLNGGQAFDTFDNILASIPAEKRGAVPGKAERSAWQTLEHMRLAQRDILDYSRNEDGSYKEMNWPDDYWPADPEPPADSSWDESIGQFHQDLLELENLIRTKDLFAEFPWGEGHTILREAMLTAEHNAHHLGQLVILQRLL